MTPKADAIDANAVLVLINSFFGPYEAVAARLKGAAPGTEIPAYGEGPMLPFRIRVGESFAEQIQTTARMVAARRTHLSMLLPGAVIEADLWVDDAGRLIRLSLPAQSLEAVREDIAAVSSRTVTISRSNDEPIK